ncbi:MAG TPA: DUF1015 family protein [Nocardioides sp.]|nr:DUF1015 family protein [Nocardioides sp.]
MDAGSLVPPPHVARPLRLLPFRGLTLTPTRIGAPSSVRAFTRPYKDVSERLLRWERRGQLSHDDRPAVYLHEYSSGAVTVRGLVGALDISHRASSWEDVAVFPHEGIHPAQADELAARMTEMQTNPAPILLVHRGPAAVRELMDAVQQDEPVREFTDRGDQHHRVWAVRDAQRLALLGRSLETARALIADGHHRYAAYLQMQHDDPRPATDAGLAMLVDQDDTPLYLGPIHRDLGHVTLEALGAAAARTGATFRAADAAPAVAALAPDTLVATDGRDWATVRLELPAGRAAVEVLHDRLLPALPHRPTRVGYHHAVEDALDAVVRRPGLAVLLPAPDFGQVLAACGDERLLPEKATSFQPKPSIGVLIRSLRDG